MSVITADNINQIASEGFVRVEALFDAALIRQCKMELEGIVAKGRTGAHLLTSNNSLHIHNFFLYGTALRRILFGPELQSTHRKVFGPNYCLRNAVASSIQIDQTQNVTQLKQPIGAGWHRDTPQFYDRNAKSRVVGSEITFQVIIAIDGSNSINSTKVLPGSHRASIPGHKLEGSEAGLRARARDLLMRPGDLAIIDDNVFHRAGLGTDESRWMLFGSYTPWYVKPYFDFSELQLPDMTPYEAHCLHKTSTPPAPFEPLRNTYSANGWETGV